MSSLSLSLCVGHYPVHLGSAAGEHGGSEAAVWYPPQTQPQPRGLLATVWLHCTGTCDMCLCYYSYWYLLAH